MSEHAHQLHVHGEAKMAAAIEARLALKKATAAADLAREKPTAKNIKAAQVATNKATRAAAKVGKHEAAIAKHTEAHGKARVAHEKAVEAHSKAKARQEAAQTKEKAAEAKAATKTSKAAEPPTKAGGQDVKTKPAAKSMTEKEFKTWRENATDGASSKLTAEERQALKTYSGDDYIRINSNLRSDFMPGGHLGDAVRGIDSAISKSSAPSDVVVYRGMSEDAKHVYSALKPGDVFHDKAFMSTSANKTVALDNFANGGAVFHITVPKGSPAIPMTKVGYHSSEREVLLPRGSRIRIDQVSKRKDGTTVIHATVHHGQ
jgi:hypothetical protein